jgi:hypothetical protein
MEGRMTNKKNRGKYPSIDAIIKANESTLRRIEFSNDEARSRCWACCGLANLERAHIVAIAHGGGNEPENFFLLCWVCHREQPDGAPPDVQLKWLASHESQIARTSRTMMPIMAWIARSVTDADELQNLDQQAALQRLILEGSYASAASSHTSNVLATHYWCAAKKFVDAVNAADVGKKQKVQK